MRLPSLASLFAAALLTAFPWPQEAARAADGLDVPAAQREGRTASRIGRNADRLEVRFGAGAYDSGPFTSQIVSGVVVNTEILFPSPLVLDAIGAPRFYLGADVAASGGETHVVYGGLNWEAYVTPRLYLGFSAGGSVNSGTRERSDLGATRDLGSRVLFHLQASAGFDLTENWTAQVYLNHYSNANLADSNNGLESTGFRLGYRF